jgi:hypothetical protein
MRPIRIKSCKLAALRKAGQPIPVGVVPEDSMTLKNIVAGQSPFLFGHGILGHGRGAVFCHALCCIALGLFYSWAIICKHGSVPAAWVNWQS